MCRKLDQCHFQEIFFQISGVQQRIMVSSGSFDINKRTTPCFARRFALNFSWLILERFFINLNQI